MVIVTMGNGSMTKPMEEVLMSIWMEPSILAIGKKINNMVMV